MALTISIQKERSRNFTETVQGFQQKVITSIGLQDANISSTEIPSVMNEVFTFLNHIDSATKPDTKQSNIYFRGNTAFEILQNHLPTEIQKEVEQKKEKYLASLPFVMKDLDVILATEKTSTEIIEFLIQQGHIFHNKAGEIVSIDNKLIIEPRQTVDGRSYITIIHKRIKNFRVEIVISDGSDLADGRGTLVQFQNDNIEIINEPEKDTNNRYNFTKPPIIEKNKNESEIEFRLREAYQLSKAISYGISWCADITWYREFASELNNLPQSIINSWKNFTSEFVNFNIFKKNLTVKDIKQLYERKKIFRYYLEFVEQVLRSYVKSPEEARRFFTQGGFFTSGSVPQNTEEFLFWAFNIPLTEDPFEKVQNKEKIMAVAYELLIFGAEDSFPDILTLQTLLPKEDIKKFQTKDSISPQKDNHTVDNVIYNIFVLLGKDISKIHETGDVQSSEFNIFREMPILNELQLLEKHLVLRAIWNEAYLQPNKVKQMIQETHTLQNAKNSDVAILSSLVQKYGISNPFTRILGYIMDIMLLERINQKNVQIPTLAEILKFASKQERFYFPDNKERFLETTQEISTNIQT